MEGGREVGGGRVREREYEAGQEGKEERKKKKPALNKMCTYHLCCDCEAHMSLLTAIYINVRTHKIYKVS